MKTSEQPELPASSDGAPLEKDPSAPEIAASLAQVQPPLAKNPKFSPAKDTELLNLISAVRAGEFATFADLAKILNDEIKDGNPVTWRDVKQRLKELHAVDPAVIAHPENYSYSEARDYLKFLLTVLIRPSTEYLGYLVYLKLKGSGLPSVSNKKIEKWRGELEQNCTLPVQPPRLEEARAILSELNKSGTNKAEAIIMERRPSLHDTLTEIYSKDPRLKILACTPFELAVFDFDGALGEVYAMFYKAARTFL